MKKVRIERIGPPGESSDWEVQFGTDPNIFLFKNVGIGEVMQAITLWAVAQAALIQ